MTWLPLKPQSSGTHRSGVSAKWGHIHPGDRGLVSWSCRSGQGGPRQVASPLRGWTEVTRVPYG